MTDKKLTDNEIIKALECCSKKNCKQCPNFSEDIECSEKLINLTLDYIARQLHELQERYEEAQAEIEKLKNENFILSQKRANIFEITEAYGRGKSETVKEFADRLKKDIFNTEYHIDRYYRRSIDKLVKEMVGKNNSDE